MLSKALFLILLFTSDVNALKLWFLSEPADSSIDSEANYYPCFRDLNCALGVEMKTQLKECMQLLQKKSRGEVFQWIKDGSRGIINTNDIDEFQEKFCGMEEYQRKEGFTAVVKKILDYYMMNCNGESETDTCENIQELKRCICDLFEENVEKKKCGFLVDLQKGKLK
ncbi:uncharacterized protein LOC129228233 [Uloborus diversus]|uniref:uncharacterized protein LOC129228233 n=1 Tax=Uloborus diversus TaxID=327109 RepID=UPI002409AE57|nr:uncharacterized protein LOC129228233 [Uloborus diversus]